MTEPERVRAIEAVQLRLFELEKYRLRLLGQIELFKSQGTKICRRVNCRKAKPVAQFGKDNRYSDGRYPYCNACKSEMVKQRNRAQKKVAA